MVDNASFVLNRRSKILHYRDGKINPPFLEDFLKYKSQDHNMSKIDCQWSERIIFLFGEENPINIVNISSIVDMVTSYKNSNFAPIEIKGNPMNGIIFPSLCISCFLMVQQYANNILRNQRKHHGYYTDINKETNLIIMIVNHNIAGRKRIKNDMSEIVKMLRKEMNITAPICIVAQSDIRNANSKLVPEFLNYITINALELLFHGPDTRASTLVIDTKNELILERKFKTWKENLDFLDSHQIIALHFTMINGSEPKNSEKIFSDTLRLHGESSIVGVDYQDNNMESNFKNGPVYVIVGIRKFGC
ncbi:DNA polymerase II large subunit [Dirofilaria immitis]